MDEFERGLWIYVLWTLSLGTVAWLSSSIVNPALWVGPMIMFAIAFVIVFITWLFRVTYVAGGRR